KAAPECSRAHPRPGRAWPASPDVAAGSHLVRLLRLRDAITLPLRRNVPAHPILSLEMTRRLVAVLLGAAIGYLAGRLADVGRLIMVGLLAGLVAYYAFPGRRRSAGLPLLASGGTV